MFRVTSVMTTSILLHKITIILYHTGGAKSREMQKNNIITKRAEELPCSLYYFIRRNILPLKGGISMLSLPFSQENLVLPWGVVPL